MTTSALGGALHISMLSEEVVGGRRGKMWRDGVVDGGGGGDRGDLGDGRVRCSQLLRFMIFRSLYPYVELPSTDWVIIKSEYMYLENTLIVITSNGEVVCITLG